MIGQSEPSQIQVLRATWWCVKLTSTAFCTAENSFSFQITEAPFVVEKCVLLVLRPKLFLPEGRPILINTRRVLRKPGGPPLSNSDAPSWTQYTPQPNRPYLIDESGQEFTEFDFISERSQEGQRLSIFSLLVNANSKLQAAKRRDDFPSGDIRVYITNVEDAIKAIFFVPREVQKQTPLLTPLVPPIPSGQQSHVPALRRSPRTQEDKGDSKKPRGQGSSNSGSEDGGLADEGRPGFEDSEEDSYEGEEEGDEGEGDGEYEDEDEYDEEDDEPDTINGLTFPEMETVIQRASDGTISAEERAEAAMLMLGMAGGELLLFSIFSLSLSDPGTRL